MLVVAIVQKLSCIIFLILIVAMPALPIMYVYDICGLHVWWPAPPLLYYMFIGCNSKLALGLGLALFLGPCTIAWSPSSSKLETRFGKLQMPSSPYVTPPQSQQLIRYIYCTRNPLTIFDLDATMKIMGRRLILHYYQSH